MPRYAPAELEELAAMLDTASGLHTPVLVWGGGTHQGIGNPVDAGVVISTARLDRVVDWEPADLTLVVEAGAKVAEIESMLADRGQTAGLPEHAGEATVGGVVAAGISGYRRARYGPTRNRLLEVTLVTGDGRIVSGGGRVVKNVSGYDLPRLSAGSFGALGVIGTVCLKLWPLPEAAATVRVDRAAVAWHGTHRPLAVLETEAGSWLYLQGTDAEVRAEAAEAGGDVRDGLHWPAPPSGGLVVSLRVPPGLLASAVDRLPPDCRYVAQHGVGVVDAAVDAPDAGVLGALREWAEAHGGALVVTGGDRPVGLDPWGTPPPALGTQRRIVAGFDPLRAVNPGRLPGGI
jgi:glycolate oxidase FAD binding subunit